MVNRMLTKAAVWDLFMDFSLLQPSSRHRFLRDITALKKRWVYYAIMVLDPILRFAWIFYAIFTHDTQHSTVVSFMVAFAEVFRRGIWALLRVENEHCSNVAVYKASRDVPLPYRLETLVEQASEEEEESRPGTAAGDGAAAAATGVQRIGSHVLQDEESGEAGSGTVRRRKTVTESGKPEGRSFSKIIAEAHRQDFVKKRKPGEEDGAAHDRPGTAVAQSDDDEDEDEEPDEDEEEMRQDVRDAEELTGRSRAGGSSRG